MQTCYALFIVNYAADYEIYMKNMIKLLLIRIRFG